MILDSNNAQACMRLVADGRESEVKLSRFKDYTLSGAMEFFATAIHLRGTFTLCEDLKTLAESHHPVWSPLWRAWESNNDNLLSEDIHGVRTIEFYRIAETEDFIATNFDLVQQRLNRTMLKNGFGKPSAKALCQVFCEMADNIVQHSAIGCEHLQFIGLVGYHVTDKYLSFCAIDLGIGALASLRTSTMWSHLQSPEDALRAIIVDHASRREGQMEGGGFKHVLQALTDRNAAIRLRSQNATIVLSPKETVREAVLMSSPNLPGMQVSLVCDLTNYPSEKKITVEP